MNGDGEQWNTEQAMELEKMNNLPDDQTQRLALHACIHVLYFVVI